MDFTLLEILMVVVIIGILAVLLVPNIAGRGDQARVKAAISDIRALGTALELYRLDNSHYPSTDQGLTALVARPSGNPEPKAWGPEPYIKKLNTDPWDNVYIYLNSGAEFDIISLGSDGEQGGDGYRADIHLSEI